MFDTWTGKQIRYPDMAKKLFPGTPLQEIIPFVGAGVSVSARTPQDESITPRFPSKEVLEQISLLLGISGEKSLLYLEYALRSALSMQALEQARGPAPTVEEFLQGLKKAVYPPFAWELAEMFSLLAPYRAIDDTALPEIMKRHLLSPERLAASDDDLAPMVQLLSRTTRVGSPTDPLTSIADVYEAGSERKDLWNHLYDVFENKKTPTETHRLIALAARDHLNHNPGDDYLAITTNYDCLIEAAMDELKVPYAVLRLNRKDRKVGNIHYRFNNFPDAEMALMYQMNKPAEPRNFRLKSQRKLAVIYKIHGCLNPELTPDDDGLIITDGDYVDFISQSDHIIPSHVGSILPGKRLLFLGYSFSDWNVRSIYQAMIRDKDSDQQDYAVTRGLSRFEETYFKKRHIVVIQTGLNDFVEGIRKQPGVPNS
jgi:hypothetical protein